MIRILTDRGHEREGWAKQWTGLAMADDVMSSVEGASACFRWDAGLIPHRRPPPFLRWKGLENEEKVTPRVEQAFS